MTYDRFTWAEALYVLCTRHHSGQWSRGYRLLSRLLGPVGFRPSISVQSGELDGQAQELYEYLRDRYQHTL